MRNDKNRRECARFGLMCARSLIRKCSSSKHPGDSPAPRGMRIFGTLLYSKPFTYIYMYTSAFLLVHTCNAAIQAAATESVITPPAHAILFNENPAAAASWCFMTHRCTPR
eukprot:scpid107692/ scgid22462/ 